MVGAGAVVTRNVPPNAVVVGNPARIKEYIPTLPAQTASDSATDLDRDIQVAGVTVHKLPLVLDMRGNLSVAEFDKHLPFAPKRYFVVFAVPNSRIRGEHAHKKLHQFLVCVNGSCSLMVDDGQNRDEILLNRPNIAVHLTPLIWAAQYNYSADAILLVFASENYDADDYIRDYDEYLGIVGKA
jgi:hypothetical protein